MYTYLNSVKGGVSVFGYVKADSPELKMRENEFYRAVYCGLCGSMKRLTGTVSTFSLSYDIVFLVLCRLAAVGDRYEVVPKRCGMNPFRMKKRPVMSDGDEMRYAAAVGALLTECKLADDANDEKGIKGLIKKILLPGARRRLKRAHIPESLEISVRSKLRALYALEAEKPDAISPMAELFGELLGELFAFGMDKTNARILYEVGKGVGRWIYILDAIDDFDCDRRADEYNPVIAVYKELSDGAKKELTDVLKLELTPAAASLELIEVPKSGYPETLDIAKNIIYLGMPKEAERVLFGEADPSGKKKKGTEN